MKTATITILEQEIKIKTSSFKKKHDTQLINFQVAWNTDEILLPDDLESGKAVEEIFMALQEALVGEYNLKEEDWLFFPEPPYSNRYFVTGVCKHQLPPEVAANPIRYWYDHTDDVWRTHY